MSRFNLRGRLRNEKKSKSTCSGPEGAAASARRLRVGVVEHEALRDEVRVVVEHCSVEIQQALLVDEDLGAFRPLEYFVPQTRLPLPRERVAQPRTPATLDANAQAAIVDALFGHQRADLARGAFADLNHAHYAVGWASFAADAVVAVCFFL